MLPYQLVIKREKERDRNGVLTTGIDRCCIPPPCPALPSSLLLSSPLLCFALLFSEQDSGKATGHRQSDNTRVGGQEIEASESASGRRGSIDLVELSSGQFLLR
jgi:hypothetical protein